MWSDEQILSSIQYVQCDVTPHLFSHQLTSMKPTVQLNLNINIIDVILMVERGQNILPKMSTIYNFSCKLSSIPYRTTI